MSKIFVISGNHSQYNDWKNRNYPEMLLNGDIQGLQDIIYVSSIERLRGVSNPKGIFIGTWYERKDIQDLIIQLRVAGVESYKIDRIQEVLDRQTVTAWG